MFLMYAACILWLHRVMARRCRSNATLAQWLKDEPDQAEDFGSWIHFQNLRSCVALERPGLGWQHDAACRVRAVALQASHLPGRRGRSACKECLDARDVRGHESGNPQRQSTAGVWVGFRTMSSTQLHQQLISQKSAGETEPLKHPMMRAA